MARRHYRRFQPPQRQWSPSLLAGASIGQRPEVPLPAEGFEGVPEDVREMAGRVLAAIVTSMRGPGAAWYIGDLAARLDIRPRTAERDDLGAALWALHAVGLARYEGQARQGAFDWHLTERGVEVARGLDIGVSGATRHRP
jgi:hypothetical protein